MPVNKPKAGETEEQYLEYCIPEEIKAGKAQDVAAAICYSNYRREKISKIKDTSIKVMARVKYDSDFTGIRLTNLGENSDACWENYIQVGTKILDGKEVPDCRGPIEDMERLAEYPWDECIADQTARYGDEETAKAVCGYIKSKYGSKE